LAVDENMTDSPSLRIALAQINPLVGDVAGNADRILEFARRAQQQGADLVVYPELALTGYPPEDLLFRRQFLDQVEAAVERLRRDNPGLAMVIGSPRRAAGELYNAALLLQPGQTPRWYHKQRLPNYGVFDEQRYFAAGGEPCVFELAGRRIGITVCEDIWYPEPAAQAREAGAGLIVNLNASPFHASKPAERMAQLSERVAETGLPVCYVNLVGGQDELVFDGQGFVMDGSGEVVLRQPAFEESLDLLCWSGNELIALSDSADELPEPEQLYRALVLATRDYVTKNGFDQVVLGLSGGIDSALVLAIAVDALGAGAVQAVMMPYRYTADISKTDAARQAALLGVRYSEIPIEKPVQAFLEVLADEFEGLGRDVTEENLQARSRGVILMAISNKKGAMLLTTGNKSEMSVGYATLYGDMAGGFAPLKDVSKLRVYALARWRNEQGEAIPGRVIERPPSAELAPGQKDEDSLPPYEVLDPILERYIEQDQSVEEIIAAGFDPQTVRRVAWLVDVNEYKRRQAPPGVRVTRRAFGKERRYPITSGFRRS
jgi:NAD+ synthase (glutamine-hydrolysing)